MLGRKASSHSTGPFSFLFGGSIPLFDRTPTAYASAVRHVRGHNFEAGFLAPPSLLRLRSCHPPYLRRGMSGVGGVSTFAFSFLKISLPSPFPLAIDYLCLSDAPGQVAPAHWILDGARNGRCCPLTWLRMACLDMNRIPDKQVTGRPPAKLGTRRTSSDEARNTAALNRSARVLNQHPRTSRQSGAKVGSGATGVRPSAKGVPRSLM